MFRSKKKKINAGSRRPVRTFDDEDENDVGTDDAQRQDADEPPSALLIALQQKKAEKKKKRDKLLRQFLLDA